MSSTPLSRRRGTAPLAAVLAALAIVILDARPVAAQMYGYAAGWNAGYVSIGDFATGPETARVGLADGWVVAVQGESWSWLPSRMLGTRVNVGFTRRPLENGDPNDRVAVTMATLDLMGRIIPPRPGGTLVPFVAGGAGLVHYDFGDTEAMAFPEAGAFFNGENRALFAVSFGGGVDVITPIRWTGEPIGVRAEVVNSRTFSSPFRDAEGERLDGVNNLRFVIGLFTGFDLFGSR